jgi:hypothetical protein
MPINQELNLILKEVWRIDEKLTSNEQLTETEKEFYNTHLETIQNYYAENNDYWKTKKSIN